MDPVRLYSILEKHIPTVAIPYCFQLWQGNPFDFRLRAKRISKVGDFTCHPGKTPRITINHDSRPYLFLLTYVHEVAHLAVHHKNGRRAEAHGREWKDTFRELLSPLLREEVFPSVLLTALKKHMIDPKASSFSDSALSSALRQYDDLQKSGTLLSEIPEGSLFGLHGRWFKKGQLKRTRVLCRELKTRQNYLVPLDAPVQSAQLCLPWTV